VSALSEVMIDLFTIYRLGWGSAYREDSGEVCHRASRGSEVVPSQSCVLGKFPFPLHVPLFFLISARSKSLFSVSRLFVSSRLEWIPAFFYSSRHGYLKTVTPSDTTEKKKFKSTFSGTCPSYITDASAITDKRTKHPSTLMKLSAISLRVRLPEPAQASLSLLDVYSFTRNEDVPLRLVMEK
jgi:hypothetical protein